MIVAICMAAPSRIRAAPGTAAKTWLANHNVGVGLQRAAERLRGHAQCCRMGCHADRNAPLFLANERGVSARRHSLLSDKAPRSMAVDKGRRITVNCRPK